MCYKEFYLIMDTTYNFSLGLFNKDTLIADIHTLKGDAKVSDTIIPEVMKLLKTNKVSIKDISFLGLTNGPGFFTGVRIGIIFAKMLRLSLKIPIITHSALEVIAYEALQNNPYLSQVLCCYNMGKSGMVYAIFDNQLKYIEHEQYIAKADVNELVNSLAHDNLAVVGNQQLLVENTNILSSDSFFKEILYPNISVLSKLARKRYANKDYNETLLPLYAKETDITIREG